MFARQRKTNTDPLGGCAPAPASTRNHTPHTSNIYVYSPKYTYTVLHIRIQCYRNPTPQTNNTLHLEEGSLLGVGDGRGGERLDRLQRANVAHIRQSRPDSGLGLQVKVLKPGKSTFLKVPFQVKVLKKSCSLFARKLNLEEGSLLGVGDGRGGERLDLHQRRRCVLYYSRA